MIIRLKSQDMLCIIYNVNSFNNTRSKFEIRLYQSCVAAVDFFWTVMTIINWIKYYQHIKLISIRMAGVLICDRLSEPKQDKSTYN